MEITVRSVVLYNYFNDKEIILYPGMERERCRDFKHSATTKSKI